jgi:hypothetical protein
MYDKLGSKIESENNMMNKHKIYSKNMEMESNTA